MALPQLTLPRYTLILPSNGQQVIFRPFTVREEKILLMADEDDEQAQIRALRQVLENCLLPDPKGKKIDVGTMAMFDLDYVWLKLRSKSVEEVVSIPFECRNNITKESGQSEVCGTVVNINLNLESIQLHRDPENNPKIDLGNGIGILMGYPNIEILQKLAKIDSDTDIDATMEVIAECIEMVYDGDKTYEREYIEHSELMQLLEALSMPQYKKVLNFFETLPVLRHTIHFKCPKCHYESDVTLEGTRDFLA